jgi:hypothetical protein
VSSVTTTVKDWVMSREIIYVLAILVFESDSCF